METIQFRRLPAEFLNMDRVPEGYYPISAFAKGNEIVVEIDHIPEGAEELHSCDWEGCGSFNHVFRFRVTDKYMEEK